MGKARCKQAKNRNKLLKAELREDDTEDEASFSVRENDNNAGRIRVSDFVINSFIDTVLERSEDEINVFCDSIPDDHQAIEVSMMIIERFQEKTDRSIREMLEYYERRKEWHRQNRIFMDSVDRTIEDSKDFLEKLANGEPLPRVRSPTATQDAKEEDIVLDDAFFASL